MRISFLALLFACIACAPPPAVLLKTDVEIPVLSVFLDADRNVPTILFEGFQQRLDNFILQYNSSRKHAFMLKRTNQMENATLHIKFIATKLVSSQQQAVGVVVTVVGLSLPIVMVASGAEFALFFFYFPKTKSVFELSLSSDIDGKGMPSNSLLTSPGFLKPADKQIEKHILHFDKFITFHINSLEKQYRKSGYKK